MKVNDDQESDETIIVQTDDKVVSAEIQTLKNRANRGSREKLLEALSKVPKVEPADADRIN